MEEGTFPESGNLIYFDLGLSTRNENKQWELYKCRHFAEWGCLQATSMRTHFAAVSVTPWSLVAESSLGFNQTKYKNYEAK